VVDVVAESVVLDATVDHFAEVTVSAGSTLNWFVTVERHTRAGLCGVVNGEVRQTDTVGVNVEQCQHFGYGLSGAVVASTNTAIWAFVANLSHQGFTGFFGYFNGHGLSSDS
jgi:hypothetical protein